MTTPRRMRAMKSLAIVAVAFVAGSVLSSGLFTGLSSGGGRAGVDGPADFLGVSLFPRVMAQAVADLGDGDFQFLPSRRSMWVVNRANGRMAAYTFLNNEYSTVQRSRVAQIDLAAFPMADSVVMMSDRNLNSIVWVANRKTGDVQMWNLARDGELRKTGPVATSADLMARS